MHHKGQERSSRKLVWVERQDIGGWGCSGCGWVFQATGETPSESLYEVRHYFQEKLYQEFDSHNCADHLLGRGAAS